MYVVLYSVYISSNFSTWFEFQTFPILSRWPPFGGDHVLWESPPIWSYGPPGQVPISINHLSVWGPGHFFYSYGSPPKHLGPSQCIPHHSEKSMMLVSLCESQTFSERLADHNKSWMNGIIRSDWFKQGFNHSTHSNRDRENCMASCTAVVPGVMGTFRMILIVDVMF